MKVNKWMKEQQSQRLSPSQAEQITFRETINTDSQKIYDPKKVSCMENGGIPSYFLAFIILGPPGMNCDYFIAKSLDGDKSNSKSSHAVRGMIKDNNKFRQHSQGLTDYSNIKAHEVALKAQVVKNANSDSKIEKIDSLIKDLMASPSADSPDHKSKIKDLKTRKRKLMWDAIDEQETVEVARAVRAVNESRVHDRAVIGTSLDQNHFDTGFTTPGVVTAASASSTSTSSHNDD